MTDEQFKRIDERLEQVAKLLTLIACNTARNSEMSAAAQNGAIKAADHIISSVKPLGGE